MKYVIFFLACSLAYADDASVSEMSFVPAGLEISDSTGSDGSASAGILGPAAGIASVIQAAAAAASTTSSGLLDFSFARGADLSWDRLFTPAKEDSDW